MYFTIFILKIHNGNVKSFHLSSYLTEVRLMFHPMKWNRFHMNCVILRCQEISVAFALESKMICPQ